MGKSKKKKGKKPKKFKSEAEDYFGEQLELHVEFLKFSLVEARSKNKIYTEQFLYFKEKYDELDEAIVAADIGLFPGDDLKASSDANVSLYDYSRMQHQLMEYLKRLKKKADATAKETIILEKELEVAKGRLTSD